eukprot:545351_1
MDIYDDGNVPPIVLVGNKIDLDKNHIAYDPNINDDGDDDDKNSNRKYSNSDSNEEDKLLTQGTPERQVTFEQAVEFGRKIGVAHYIETSAKTGYNVENMIGKIVRHLINIKYRNEQKKRGRKTTTSETKWWTKCQIL